MRRLLFVLVLAASSLLLVPPPAFACSCVEAPLQDHLDADVIVAGIVDATTEPLLATQGERTMRVHVDRVYQGTAEEWLDVDTGGPCGFDYPLEGREVLFMTEDGDDLSVSLCGGTDQFSAAEVEALLGAGTEPEPGGPGPYADLSEYAGLAAAGAGASLVALAGALWLRLRRA